ncbi:MAG: hypothetical protein NXH89_06325 [Cyclobacteriaceae bacterium]|nr:hypothetical protein [Cyclobacteriaceae bacterium]
MYSNYLPPTLPDNWKLAEIDQENDYIEFLGFDEELLVSIIAQPADNPEEPYFLCLSQLKGMLGRYDFDSLDWPEWHTNEEMAVRSAINLMEWINQNYQCLDPLSKELYISLGTEEQLPLIQKFFDEELKIHEYREEKLVFKKARLLAGSNSFSESAIQTISHFAQCYNLPFHEIKGGLLFNERFQLIEDFRHNLFEYLKSIEYHPSNMEIKYPTEVGQIVKFHSPYPDEDPNQLYLLIEIFDYEGEILPKADIKALNTGLSFPPIQSVKLKDLEIAEVNNSDLIGFEGTIISASGSYISGKITEVSPIKQTVNLTKRKSQVDTNVAVIIEDPSGEIHQGYLTVLF